MAYLDTDRRLHRQALQLAFGVVLLVVWYVGHLANPLGIPTPIAVVEAFVTQVQSGALPEALRNGLQAILTGYFFAILAGVTLGVVITADEVLEKLFDPYVTAFYVLPLGALVPAMILWFGTGFLIRVLMVFFFAFFPILINTMEGVKTTPRDLVEVAQSFNASKLQIIRMVIIPHEIPYIMAGLRLGINLAVKGLVVAEIIVAVTGFGQILTRWGSAFKMGGVFSVIITLMLLGILLTWLLKRIEEFVVGTAHYERGDTDSAPA